jgi:hypothetical protein
VSIFGKRVNGPPSRRWLKRRRVGIGARAALAEWSTTALIQDLSLTGARLLGRDLPGPTARLTLHVGERSVAGEIVWAVGDQRGVRLDFARR